MLSKKSFALLMTNSPRRLGDLTNVWGGIKWRELASVFGNCPGDMSTNNRRVFRLSAENWSQSSLGLFRQYRSKTEVAALRPR
jgi:hypothetical protein